MSETERWDVSERLKIHEGIMRNLLKNDLTLLLGQIYDVFQAPVLLTDVNSVAVFQYPKQKIGDFAYDTLLTEGILPPKLLENDQKRYQHDKYSDWPPFLSKKGLAEEYPRIVSIVKYKGIKQYILAVYTGKQSATQEELDMLQLFSHAAELMISSNESDSLLWAPPTLTCLQTLLSNEISSKLSTVSAELLSENMTGNFVVISTEIGTDEQKNFSYYAVRHIMRQYRDVVSTVFENHIVTLVGEVKGDVHCFRGSDFIQTLVDFFYSYNLISGISSPFGELSMLKRYYRQANVIAEFAMIRHKEKCLYAHDLSEQLIYHLSADNEVAPLLIHPLLFTISEYDKDKNTTYFENLRAYALSFYNKDLAAASLYIHRNTFVYRLGKIEDIFGVDLEDQTLRHNLYSSFRLYDAIYREQNA